MKSILAAEMYLYGEAETGNVSFRHFPPGGEDKLDDMAQAWLDGNTTRYEVLRREHELRFSNRVGRKRERNGRFQRPSVSKGLVAWTRSKRVIDWNKVRELRATGLSINKIAAALGCSTSRVWTIIGMTKSE